MPTSPLLLDSYLPSLVVAAENHNFVMSKAIINRHFVRDHLYCTHHFVMNDFRSYILVGGMPQSRLAWTTARINYIWQCFCSGFASDE